MGHMKKEDARVVRTKNELRSGLLRLLKNKPLERISVMQICSETHVNKMTFYKHYDDKFDLLDDCVRSMVSSIAGEAGFDYSQPIPADLSELISSITIHLIDRCLEYKDVILSVSNCSSSLGSAVVKSALEQIIAHFLSVMSEQYGFEYARWNIASFLSGGFSSLVLRILHEGSYDKEKYYRSIRQLLDLAMKANLIQEQ